MTLGGHVTLVIVLAVHFIYISQTRQMHGIDIQGAVVILDEAHNIVSV